LLLSLINDILDLSKIEAGQLDLQPSEFPLQDVLDSGIAMVRERANRHGILLQVSVDPRVDIVRADERKLKQIVFNLLSNAVKFAPDGGQVQVTACALDGQIEIAVEDDGNGVPLEEQELIFQPFYQSPGGASIGHEGTGLGLSLARKFVELHGGHLWVESTPGTGAKFVFTLPILSPSMGEGEGRGASPAGTNGAGGVSLGARKPPSVGAS
jgi:signal transduction histidine kinase